MKFDQHGCLVREKPREPGHEIANLGDSCADTCRALILGKRATSVEPVIRFTDDWKGFLRHPELKDKRDWDRKSFTNDQLVPLIMAQYVDHPIWVRFDLFVSCGFIRGTWKLAQPMVYALLLKQWWLVDKLNHLQGWLLTWSFRWSDDAHEGIGFKSSSGKVQDYPTMICTTVFLNRMGYKAVVPRPFNECLAAVIKYRQDPADFEPNSESEIDLYREALHKYAL
jgi:hypothetical protein